jgi:hypothetical protein
MPELVAAHDLDADAGGPSACERFVDSAGPLIIALESHLLEGTRGEGPLHQARPGVSERRLEPLPLTRTEAVEGDRKIMNADE